MQILRASEDYLEAMLMMQKEHGYVRSIDIAEKLGVTKPSVTYATKRLRENGYITMDKDGLITLTEQGMSIASSMLDRHQTLTRFLMALGVEYCMDRFFRAAWQPTWSLVVVVICVGLIIPLRVVRRVPSLREEARRRFNM